MVAKVLAFLPCVKALYQFIYCLKIKDYNKNQIMRHNRNQIMPPNRNGEMDSNIEKGARPGFVPSKR